MKAILHEKYGAPDLLRCREVNAPAPKPDEVLIKVHAAGVNALDWRLLDPWRPLAVLTGSVFSGPRTPLIGRDFAGHIETIGHEVTKFKPGDKVFGSLLKTTRGCFAGYTCATERRIARMPDGVSFEAAAAAPVAALTALAGLRFAGGVRPGQKVLVLGAGGGVGTFALQLARSFGAEVTAVTSTDKIDMVRSLGAAHVIDYTKEDPVQAGVEYDIVYDAAGHRPHFGYLRIVKKGGACVVTGFTKMLYMLAAVFLGPLARLSGKRAGFVLLLDYKVADLEFLADALGTGKIQSAIDRRYPLEKASEALTYAATGGARGKVIITVG